jgi:hypothetical protein
VCKEVEVIAEADVEVVVVEQEDVVRPAEEEEEEQRVVRRPLLYVLLFSFPNQAVSNTS